MNGAATTAFALLIPVVLSLAGCGEQQAQAEKEADKAAARAATVTTEAGRQALEELRALTRTSAEQQAAEATRKTMQKGGP